MPLSLKLKINADKEMAQFVVAWLVNMCVSLSAYRY